LGKGRALATSERSRACNLLPVSTDTIGLLVRNVALFPRSLAEVEPELEQWGLGATDGGGNSNAARLFARVFNDLKSHNHSTLRAPEWKAN